MTPVSLNIMFGDAWVIEFTFGDGECRAPLVSQDIETDAAVAVDVGVVDASGEVDLWWLEWVVGGEVDRKEEDAARVGRVTGTHDGCLPVELQSHMC
jgi:hypothetical protein